jgi:hypothetical protein
MLTQKLKTKNYCIRRNEWRRCWRALLITDYWVYLLYWGHLSKASQTQVLTCFTDYWVYLLYWGVLSKASQTQVLQVLPCFTECTCFTDYWLLIVLALLRCSHVYSSVLALLGQKYKCWRCLFDAMNVAEEDIIVAIGTYADVCWRICWRMLTYADVCWRMLTYADVCWRMNVAEEDIINVDWHDVHMSCLKRALKEP